MTLLKTTTIAAAVMCLFTASAQADETRSQTAPVNPADTTVNTTRTEGAVNNDGTMTRTTETRTTMDADRERGSNRHTMAQTWDNATMTTKVKSALAADAGLGTLMLNVDSNEGVVTINGDVKSNQQKEAVTRISSGVEGVTSVVNNTMVKPER